MSLEIRDLGYVRGIFSLDGISLNIENNTILGIGGQNGSGKSTLLKLMYGFLRRTRGEVSLNGVGIDRLSSREISRKIAVVSQEISEPFNFTAGDIVELSGYSRQHNGLDVIGAMESCGIAHLRDRSFSELSGGEKRLVMISAAVYQDSDIILLDEPTAFLDVDKEMRVLNIMRKLKARGKTLVVVLHDINLLYRLCDRVALLRDGKLISSGTRDEVLTIDNLEKAYSLKFRILEDGGPFKFAPAEDAYL